MPSFRMFGLPHAAAVLLAMSITAAPAPAARGEEAALIDPSQEYADCMTLARRVPEDAFESALAWETTAGGGIAARHCAAVALIQLGEYGEAATRLERIARDVPADRPGLAADLLGQAGQAWIMIEEIERAYAAQTAALALDPNDVELLIDRSVTLATAANYWEAIDDLNRANELAPGRADILVLRASAYRYVDGLELAREDVERALRLDPGNPEALLERGMIRRLSGDADGARADWLDVVTRAPGTATAEMARLNLERLDVKTE